MLIERIYREYFGKAPTADDAAEMADYERLPEMTIRAAFDRTRRFAERPSWAYCKTILDRASSPTPAGAQQVRRSVLCDHCSKPFDVDWMVPEQYWAYCKGCIDHVRAVVSETGYLVDEEHVKRREYLEKTGRSLYSPSAIVVRQHFGLDAA